MSIEKPGERLTGDWKGQLIVHNKADKVDFRHLKRKEHGLYVSIPPRNSHKHSGSSYSMVLQDIESYMGFLMSFQ